MSHVFKIDMQAQSCGPGYKWKVPNSFPNWLLQYISGDDVEELVEKWQDKSIQVCQGPRKLAFIGLGITIGLCLIFIIVIPTMNNYEWYWFWS